MIYLLIWLLGLAFGSFLNVLITRIPEGENIAYPPSRCPKCKSRLKWWHNIPVLSWIILGGKCYYCKSKISLQYPLIEILTSFIFLLVFVKAGISYHTLLLSIAFSLLLALSIIDFYYKAVPDSLNLGAFVIALAASRNILESLQSALLLAGAFTMLRFFVSYALSLSYEGEIKKNIKNAPWLKNFYPKFVQIEAMGEGDIIIAATMGAILGLKLALIAIFLSAFLALPASLFFKYARKEAQLPYIPFLALALWIVYMFDDKFKIFLEWLNG
ncbi:prepilin peptidase [Nitrosophilus alvini]|uniref:prepilin peptidase n=1 Tax=Nitrosophilus alvini TaxID=2714855 RepID=UPI0019099FBD|nr:A24 family peptidase [Nitrosophilus alvini]